MYVAVQINKWPQEYIHDNTIPTAREEQGVIQFRGESRPASLMTLLLPVLISQASQQSE
jgi:hypothetical protein